MKMDNKDGATTTPLDIVVSNDHDRFHLFVDVIERVPRLGYPEAYLKEFMRNELIEHSECVVHHGQELPKASEWRWPGKKQG